MIVEGQSDEVIQVADRCSVCACHSASVALSLIVDTSPLAIGRKWTDESNSTLPDTLWYS